MGLGSFPRPRLTEVSPVSPCAADSLVTPLGVRMSDGFMEWINEDNLNESVC